MNKFLRLAVSGALLAALAWGTDWGQVRGVFAHVRTGYLLAAVALYVATQLVSAWRWQVLARPLGFHRPLWQYAGFYFIGMFFNLFLPTSVGGDVVRAWYLDGKSGRRLGAFLSVFTDRLSGLLVLVTLAALASLVSPVPLERWVVAGVWGAVAAAVLGLAALPQLGRFPALGEKYARLGAEAGRSLAQACRPLPLVLSIVVQSANVILLWLVGLAITAKVPASYYWVMVPLVTLATMLPITFNGMGVREGAMVVFLAPLGVPAGTAVSLAFLWFSVFSAVSVLGGAVYLFGRFPRPEGQPEHGPLRHHPDQGRDGQLKAAA